MPTEEEYEAMLRRLFADVPYMDEDPEYFGLGERE